MLIVSALLSPPMTKHPKPLDRRTYEKNLANMKLLVTYEPFHNEILRIRDHLDIPPNGLPQNNDALAAWSDKMNKRADEMIESPNIKRMIAAIGAKLKREEITYKQANLQARMVYHSMPWNYLSEEISFLIAKYRIPNNYNNHIRDYIITGRINAPYQNFAIIFDTQIPLSEGRKRKVGIEIYTRPTNEELHDIKKTLDMWARDLPQFKVLKNIDDKLGFERWAMERFGWDEVEAEPYRVTAKEIIEKLPKNKKSVQSVYDSRRELAALRRKRFGNN